MKKYLVYMTNTVSYAVEVEAEDAEAAIDKAEHEGLPGLMMLDHRYPDEGGWVADEAEEVADD